MSPFQQPRATGLSPATTAGFPLAFVLWFSFPLFLFSQRWPRGCTERVGEPLVLLCRISAVFPRPFFFFLAVPPTSHLERKALSHTGLVLPSSRSPSLPWAGKRPLLHCLRNVLHASRSVPQCLTLALFSRYWKYSYTSPPFLILVPMFMGPKSVIGFTTFRGFRIPPLWSTNSLPLCGGFPSRPCFSSLNFFPLSSPDFSFSNQVPFFFLPGWLHVGPASVSLANGPPKRQAFTSPSPPFSLPPAERFSHPRVQSVVFWQVS